MSNDKTMTVTAPSGAIIPRTIDEVARLARMAAASGLAKTTSPEAAGMLICAGLEIGLTPMQALLGMHMVEGRPTLAADTIVALVMRRTDVCEYWHTIEATTERHTIETKRRGDGFVPERRTWTTEDAKRAGLLGKPIWQRYPADMLRHRCATALARAVYPDVIAGMAYTREEIADGVHRGDDVPQPAINLDDPNGSTVNSLPDNVPTSLPRDNGLSPSQASALRPLSAAEHAAMVDTVRGAKTREDLDREVADLAEDAARGTDAQRSELRAAIIAARKALAAPPPSDDPPPDGPTKPRRGPRRAPQGDAAADSSAAPPGASTGAQDGPAAWLATEADTAEHARGLATGHAVEASARKHNAALAATPWGVRVYAERLAALEGASVDQCARYVVAWCKHGPKAAATAQRRAA